MRYATVAAFLMSAIALPTAAFGRCNLDLQSPGQLRYTGDGGSGYDGFARSRFETDFTLIVENRDTTHSCQALISLQRAPHGRGLKGSGESTLDYQIAQQGNRTNLIEIESNAGRPQESIPITLAPGQRVTRSLTLHVPPGQVVPSGRYDETLLLRILDLSSFEILAERSVQVETRVVQQASILIYDGSIARPAPGENGTRNRRLDFGTLEQGEIGTVTMLIQANDDYSLRITSPHRGSLWHSVYGSSDVVGYTAYLGSHRLNLSSGSEIVRGKSATGLEGSALPLKVQIGPTGIARAGRYEDQLTISILPDC